MSAENAQQPRLTDRQHALLEAFAEVVEQCHNVIEAHEKRAAPTAPLTLHELQELAVLRIRLDDLADVQATRGAEAS